MSRICTTCKAEKSETEFYADKNAKDGLRRMCKACHIKLVLEYNNKHPETIKVNRAIHRERNGDAIRAKAREYQRNNREKKAAHQREYYVKNKEKVLARARLMRQNRRVAAGLTVYGKPGRPRVYTC